MSVIEDAPSARKGRVPEAEMNSRVETVVRLAEDGPITTNIVMLNMNLTYAQAQHVLERAARQGKMKSRQDGRQKLWTLREASEVTEVASLLGTTLKIVGLDLEDGETFLRAEGPNGELRLSLN